MRALLKELVLRRWEPSDTEAIETVLDAAFEAPAGREHSVETQLTRDLAADGDLLRALCIVADRAGEIVGAVACSRGRVGQVPAVGLGPIAVPPPLQRRGIGAALMSSVIVTADQAGEPLIALLGDPAYYEEFWFEPAARHSVTAPDPRWPQENFMVRPLQAWRPEMAGQFRYASAFDRL